MMRENRAEIEALESSRAETSGENLCPAFTGFDDLQQKKTYSSPRLSIYGNVKSLVKGGSAGSAELLQCTSFSRRDRKCNQASDRRIKEAIIRIGRHSLGFGLYLFKYKPEFRDAWGHGRRFGVMADEVEAVMPDAVFMHRDGYKVVDYGRLGMSPTDSGV